MTLEELLNKLIEKGWKPFGESRIDEINRAEQYAWNWNWCCWGSKDAIQRRKSTRQLVSKESWLWQFVCENRLENPKEWKQRTDLDEDDREYVKYSTKFYEYRLIESALCDEDNLEQFLLENIKVE